MLFLENSMPCATHNVYIVYESDEIFHSIILLGKLRVTWNLSQYAFVYVCMCVRSHTAGTVGYVVHARKERNSIHDVTTSI